MTYKLNGKNIRIPDTDIERSMKALSITKEEAIQVWLEDEGYLDNEEQNELERLAKENRVTATIHQASARDKSEKKKTTNKRLPDPEKVSIISSLAELLPQVNCIDNGSVSIANPGKLITFTVNGQQYTLDLIFNRKINKKK